MKKITPSSKLHKEGFSISYLHLCLCLYNQLLDEMNAVEHPKNK